MYVTTITNVIFTVLILALDITAILLALGAKLPEEKIQLEHMNKSYKQ